MDPESKRAGQALPSIMTEASHAEPTNLGLLLTQPD